MNYAIDENILICPIENSILMNDQRKRYRSVIHNNTTVLVYMMSKFISVTIL